MSSRRGSWKSKKGKKNKETEGPPEPDTSAAIGETDLKHKDVKVYLVKLPDMLAEQFEMQPGDSKEVIGRLRIPSEPVDPNLGAQKQPTPRMFLDSVRATKSLPRKSVVTEYDVEFQLEDSKVMVFSQNRKGEDPDVRMEGVVSHQCVARPKLDDKYRGLSKRRTAMSNKQGREILLLEESDRKAYERDAFVPLAMSETAKEREERKRKKEGARRHLDVPDEEYQEAVKIAVFQAYGIQSHYTADELVGVTDTPIQRLRPIISAVCIYNKSGAFSGKYELKDEYKTVAQREQKERDVAAYEEEQLELYKKRREEQAEREKDLASSKKSRLS